MKFAKEFRLQTKLVALWFGMIAIVTLLDRLGDGRIFHWAQGLVFIAAVASSVLLTTAARR